MQIAIDSELVKEIIDFVGNQPCKSAYVLYTKLLMFSKNAVHIQQPTEPASLQNGDARADGKVVGEMITEEHKES